MLSKFCTYKENFASSFTHLIFLLLDMSQHTLSKPFSFIFLGSFKSPSPVNPYSDAKGEWISTVLSGSEAST